MADDIVERLRAIGEEEMYQAPATTKRMIEEAADEIERLRKRLEIPEPPFEAYDGIACRDETIKALDARVARLQALLAEEREAMREALTSIIARVGPAAGGSTLQALSGLSDVEAIARAALRAGTGESEG